MLDTIRRRRTAVQLGWHERNYRSAAGGGGQEDCGGCHRLGAQGVPHTVFHIPCSTYHVPHTERVEAYPQLAVCFQVEESVSFDICLGWRVVI